jgi:hypothetical protein
MAGPTQVHVPQADGEITFTIAGDVDDKHTFRVTDHLVSPRSNDEQQQLLVLVEGARLATKGDLPKSDPKGSGNDGAGTPGPATPKGS